MLMDTGGAVGAEAVTELDAAQQEVLLELAPLLRSGVTIFDRFAQCAPVGNELLVVGDDGLGEHRGVAAGGVEVEVAQQRGHDVEGEP